MSCALIKGCPKTNWSGCSIWSATYQELKKLFHDLADVQDPNIYCKMYVMSIVTCAS